MSLWTQRLRVQQEYVKPEWASGLVPFHFSQVKLCVCICCIHTICLPVYYIRIGLEASENELACCHLLKKSFGTFREFQLPLLLLLQFLWLIRELAACHFYFCGRELMLVFPAHHTGLVISTSQCRNPRGDSGTPELLQSKPDAALSWPCSFSTWTWVWAGLITLLPFLWVWSYSHSTKRHLYPHGQEGKEEEKQSR